MVYYGSVSQDTQRTNCQLSRALPIILSLDRPPSHPCSRSAVRGWGREELGGNRPQAWPQQPWVCAGARGIPWQCQPGPHPRQHQQLRPTYSPHPQEAPSRAGPCLRPDCEQQEPTARSPRADAHRHHHQGLNQRQDPAAGAAEELSCSLLAGSEVQAWRNLRGARRVAVTAVPTLSAPAPAGSTQPSPGMLPAGTPVANPPLTPAGSPEPLHGLGLLRAVCLHGRRRSGCIRQPTAARGRCPVPR